MQHPRFHIMLALIASALLVAPAVAQAPAGDEPADEVADEVAVGPGTWRPLYPAEGEEEIYVDPFMLDVQPVTNGEFLEFTVENPKWRRDQVPSLFADDAYLSHWKSSTELGDEIQAEQPVTYVSWWAARAYCEAHGKRLPFQREWELAAMASETKYDATDDPEFLARILNWYSRPGNAEVQAVGSRPANLWGVQGLHGSIWEWVEDFHAALIVVDNRADGKVDTSLFCGAGAIAAPDKGDYAAFMRLGFRSSLEAKYATRNLGFRCARDLPEGDLK